MADPIRTRALTRIRTQRWRERCRASHPASQQRADPLGAHPSLILRSLDLSFSDLSSSKNSTGSSSTEERRTETRKTETGTGGNSTWQDRRLVPVIPLWWIERLRVQRRVSHHLWVAALVILHWQTQTGGSTWFWIGSADFFPQCEMSRYAIRRALNRLQALGLIQIFRQRGKMPMVRILAEPKP
jgi:hypothetical protein